MPIRSWREHLPPGTTWAPSQLTARGSLPAAWAEVWGSAPEAPALLETPSPGAGLRAGSWVTAGEVNERTRAAVVRLWDLGLATGDRVLWSTGSSVASVVANVAVLRAGMVVVPANPAYRAREIAHIVGDVRPAAAVVDDPERARLVRSLAPWCQVLSPDLHRLPADSSRAARKEENALCARPHQIDAALSGDPALVAFTSGTTGAPKGAVLSHGNVLANSEAVALTWRWRCEDRLVHALPIFHGHGLCVALYTSLLVGGSVVLLPRFDADVVLDACDRYGASLFFGVPTQYFRIANSSRGAELSRLRLAVSGSAPLPADLHVHLREHARTVVLERYGMTETLMTVSNPYEGERRPGSVGFPFPGVELRLVDAEGHDVDLDGAQGEVVVRGPAVFAGYWQRPSATVDSLRGGWFSTGDVGATDDGYLRILGRTHDMILSGGYNVYPAEVEDVLLSHPAVCEVAVTGTPSAEWGEVVTAWVVVHEAPAHEDDLLSFAAQRLAPYKCPRLVRFVDALPRNTMGKVLRSELR
jgi:malonyl-CoA/methylmalonyl-CoA synthetase